MDTFINLLSLIGSLGLFLYGMKIMSEGLEKFAGDRLRNILSSMTRNRVMGVLTGILVTGLIQSSSATTVMVVSFVNAGLMTLAQSIGVIMGANIGTTVTAWIISAIGFKVNIAAFSLPLLAIGMPFIFSGKSKRKSLGEFIFGFALLFMGLNYLQSSSEALNIGDMVASLLVGWAGNGGFFTILLFVLVGALMTMIMQSSSAAMAVTLMLFDMNIPGFGFELAAALAMGQNIGTTVTAVIASFTANTQAKRAALAHMFFNVFGVVVVLIFFHPFCNAITWLVTDVMMAPDNALFKLSMFHTTFNVLNTLILIWFVKQIETFVCYVLPQKNEQDEEYRLCYISGGLLSTAELSILEAQKEINVFAERCQRMFGFVRNLLNADKNEEFVTLFSRIEKYEEITDRMEVEIANYLNQVSEGRLSSESKTKIQHMLRQVDELESIGDCCFNLGRTLNRKRKYLQEEFTPEQVAHIQSMIGLVEESLVEMVNVVASSEAPRTVPVKALNLETEINNFRSQLKNQNIQDVNNHLYSYQIGVFYSDFISECEKLADYILNVVQATCRTQN